MSVALLAIAFRVYNALATYTFFQPDEFFQSLEVAHRMVFGYGKLTWEWQPITAIRSPAYAALYVPIYWLLQRTGLDETSLLLFAPKLLSGLFASLTDIWVYELAKTVLGERYALVTFFLSIVSFFHGISLTRSMSNSLETSLTVMALALYPLQNGQLFDIYRIQKSLFLAGLACIVRPTAAVLWVYMFGLLMWRLRNDTRMLINFILNVVFLSVLFVSALLFLDTQFYGKLTFTPLNFLRTNLSSVSSFYGTNPWHYYVSQALPILCTTSLPFVLHGIYTIMKASPQRKLGNHLADSDASLKTLIGLVAWTVGIYSLTGHKEWRFIHPLLPVLQIFAAKSLVGFYDAQHGITETNQPPPASAKKSLFSLFKDMPVVKIHAAFIILPIFAVNYLTTKHSRGQISVMEYFRTMPSEDIQTLGFLMPCHSTPWQSHLHKPELEYPGRLWALGCEPPVFADQTMDMSEYKDQTDVFYESPIGYLRDRFPSVVDHSFPPSPNPISLPTQQPVEWTHEWPKHLVVFGALFEDPEVEELLINKLGYSAIWAEGNGLEEDPRRRGSVIILRAQKAQSQSS